MLRKCVYKITKYLSVRGVAAIFWRFLLNSAAGLGLPQNDVTFLNVMWLIIL